ncbi:biotin/lipoyl-binding protein, partial [Phenylobacterium sp.]|uniref:biotin/lipoyl-binding protein n=1 Tax=Phenylobacterium sp. TaxID=1871053 RepID=UPI0035B499D8
MRLNIKRLTPVLLALVVLAAAGGYLVWRAQNHDGLPPGIAQANGRVELQRYIVAAKMAGRLVSVVPREGDEVSAGAVLATQETSQLDARAAAASANIAAAREAQVRAAAEVRARRAALDLARTETRRADELVDDEAVSRADADRRRTQRDAAEQALAGAQAAEAQAQAMVAAADAQLAEVRSAIADAQLKAPAAGRVEYRL